MWPRRLGTAAAEPVYAPSPAGRHRHGARCPRPRGPRRNGKRVTHWSCIRPVPTDAERGGVLIVLAVSVVVIQAQFNCDGDGQKITTGETANGPPQRGRSGGGPRPLSAVQQPPSPFRPSVVAVPNRRQANGPPRGAHPIGRPTPLNPSARRGHPASGWLWPGGRDGARRGAVRAEPPRGGGAPRGRSLGDTPSRLSSICDC